MAEPQTAQVETANDIEVVRRYVALVRRRRELETALSDVKAQMVELKDAVLRYFQTHGVQHIKVDGCTVALRRSLYASAANGDKAALMEALRQAGEDWAFLVRPTVHASQLSARVRECERDENDMPILPEILRDKIRVAEVFDVSVTHR